MAERTPEASRTPDTWFAARRYGYGAGRPVSWQGWVTVGTFLFVTLGSTLGMVVLRPERPLVALLVVNGINLVAVGLFLWICKTRTAGGWRWRWGEKD